MQTATQKPVPTYTETQVGDHATYLIGSDRYPVTVVAVHRNGRSLDVQFDTATPNGGHSYYGHQRYMITRNPKGRIERFNWKPTWGMYTQPRGCGHLSLGTWSSYSDPSF